MVDLDGKINYSPVQTVSNPDARASGFSIFPNPAHDGRLYIKAMQPGSAKVFNQLGQQVLDVQVRAGLQEIDIHQLANGMYRINQGGVTQCLIIIR